MSVLYIRNAGEVAPVMANHLEGFDVRLAVHQRVDQVRDRMEGLGYEFVHCSGVSAVFGNVEVGVHGEVLGVLEELLAGGAELIVDEDGKNL